MRNKLIKIFITTLIFLFPNITLSEGVYKWKDTNGNIHYGDHPIGAAEQIKIRNKHAPSIKQEHVDHNQKRDRLLNVYEEDRKEKKSKKIMALKDKKAQKHKCFEAEKSLQQYQSAGYLYKLDADGNRVILDDSEHKIALATAQNSVEQYCG